MRDCSLPSAKTEDPEISLSNLDKFVFHFARNFFPSSNAQNDFSMSPNCS